MAKLLEVKNLKVTFDTMAGIVKAVDGVSYHIDEEDSFCPDSGGGNRCGSFDGEIYH